MNSVSFASASAGVFDPLASSYDIDFTQTNIGRAQRSSVWRIAKEVFRPGQTLLELNCGTGEDALFFARNSIAVVACDAAAQMVRVAAARHMAEMPDAVLSFHHLPTEQIDQLPAACRFDGVFSNFSGLNFLPDLTGIARTLATRIRPGSSMLLCLSTRVCLMEIVYYLLHGLPRKAFRRISGHTTASLADQKVTIYYPTLRRLRREFILHFELVSVTGIGVAIPPSYLEPWARHHPRIFRSLCKLESYLAVLPIFRVTGDHMLLHLRRKLA